MERVFRYYRCGGWVVEDMETAVMDFLFIFGYKVRVDPQGFLR